MPENTCLKCKGCCRFNNIRSKWSPSFLKKEISSFKEKKIKFSLREKSKRIKLVSSGNYFFCPFFDNLNNKCSVYKIRPFDCRLYPFLLRRVKKRIFLAIDLNCPYIEKTIESRVFKKYLKTLIKFLKQKIDKEILLDNLQFVGPFREKNIRNLLILR